MKKLTLAMIILTGIAFTSCQKEEVAQPTATLKLKKVADIRDVGTWDGRNDSLPSDNDNGGN